MCGIAGIISADPDFVSVDKLKRMTNSVIHRGPDDEGHWLSSDGKVGFGHRRLSIIDLSVLGKQPMHYMGRYTITFNGEIYNYIELKDELSKVGYTFLSHSDTEVLMALYDYKGENFLDDLDGMFSFALYDLKQNMVFFARDRFGEKPFHYYYRQGNFFAFGSEMKELWAIGIEKNIDPEMMFRYLNNDLLYNPDDLSQTFYKSIFRLEQGHCAIINISDLSLKIKKYWQLDFTRFNHSIKLNEATEKFREMFLSSVNKRLRSDVPVGSSLSGGLDSSLVVCAINYLKRGHKQTQKTFSAQFPGFNKDESYFQKLVIDKVKTEAFYTYPGYENMLRNLDDVFLIQEEPFSSTSVLAQYDVFKLAKENNVKVLLDGQGADEYLAGYHHFYKSFFLELISSGNFKESNRQKKLYGGVHENNKINGKIKHELTEFIKNESSRFLNNKLPFIPALLKRAKSKINPYKGILNKEFYATYSDKISLRDYNFKDLNQSLNHSILGGPMQELLRYADRNSMANSLEVRLPFLDHNMVQFIFSLSSHFKLHEGWTKYILRKSFSDLLPPEICWRVDKIGYEPPQNNWMQNKEIQEIIIESKKGLINEGIVDRSLLSDKTSDSNKINWKLLMGYKLTKQG